MFLGTGISYYHKEKMGQQTKYPLNVFFLQVPDFIQRKTKQIKTACASLLQCYYHLLVPVCFLFFCMLIKIDEMIYFPLYNKVHFIFVETTDEKETTTNEFTVNVTYKGMFSSYYLEVKFEPPFLSVCTKHGR